MIVCMSLVIQIRNDVHTVLKVGTCLLEYISFLNKRTVSNKIVQGRFLFKINTVHVQLIGTLRVRSSNHKHPQVFIST